MNSHRKYGAMVANAQGHLFEQMVEAACRRYAEMGKACINEIPELLRVLSKTQGNI